MNEIGLERDVHDLSGDQRTKVLLDEPTNFLDVEHIEWLKKYLLEYDHALILISHDITFLNSVVNLIHHMENQQLTRYPGDYNEFLRVYEVKKKLHSLKTFVAKNKANAATNKLATSQQKSSIRWISSS